MGGVSVEYDWAAFGLTLGAFVAAYTIGSLSWAVWVSRLVDLPDPRKVGSKNPGATNVLRLGSKKAAAAALLGDIGKGALPVAVASHWFQGWALSAIAAAPVLGHLFPLFSGFRGGGRGVATGLGVYIPLSPLVAALLLGTWLIIAALTRYASLASVLAAVSLPVWTAVWAFSPPLLALSGLLTVLVIWRHFRNLQRLLQGRETRIGQRE